MTLDSTPSNIPHKNISAKIEAAIRHLPDDSKDAVRTSSAAVLYRARLPAHNNEKRKALNNLKKDQSRVVMKADKGTTTTSIMTTAATTTTTTITTQAVAALATMSMKATMMVQRRSA